MLSAVKLKVRVWGWCVSHFTAVTSPLVSVFLQSRCWKRGEWKYWINANRGSFVAIIHKHYISLKMIVKSRILHSHSVLFGSKVEPLFTGRWVSQTRWLMVSGSSSSRASDHAGESVCDRPWCLVQVVLPDTVLQGSLKEAVRKETDQPQNTVCLTSLRFFSAWSEYKVIFNNIYGGSWFKKKCIFLSNPYCWQYLYLLILYCHQINQKLNQKDQNHQWIALHVLYYVSLCFMF